jgi:hypothetical protein
MHSSTQESKAMLNACGLPGNPESFIPPDSEALAIEESPKQEGKSSALESSGKSRAFLDVVNERHGCSSLMLLTWTGRLEQRLEG